MSELGHNRKSNKGQGNVCFLGVNGHTVSAVLTSESSHKRTLALQHIDELATYESSSSKALASCKSGVSKPSVNQP